MKLNEFSKAYRDKCKFEKVAGQDVIVCPINFKEKDKLKTLKDLGYIANLFGMAQERILTESELKQSAIDDIKELRKITVEDDHEQFVRNSSTIEYIMKKFNIKKYEIVTKQ